MSKLQTWVKIVALIGLGLVFLETRSSAADNDIAIVANPYVPATDLSLNEVRKLLLGDRQFWSSNLRVTLLMRAPAARERDVVLKTVYQMSESQFQQYWIGKVFRAETAAGPKIVNSNQALIELLTSIPGSIGFLDAAQAPQSLKVLRVDGKLPGEKGYPIR